MVPAQMRSPSAVSSPVKMPSGLRLQQFQWSCSLGLGCLADGIQKQLSLEQSMEHLSVKKAINLARTLGVAGLLAVALVTTSGCIRTDNHQPESQVSTSDSSQEEGAVYGKMEYSITGVEVHDSADDDGGKVAVVRWHAINNRTADSFATEATLRPIRISRCFMAVLPPICRKIPSLRKGLRREANATVCRFSNSMTCPPLKLRSTARALDRTLSTRPLNWNRPHSI